MSISISELTRKAKYYNNIKKEGVDIELDLDYEWVNNERIMSFMPTYNNVDNFLKVSKICETTNSPILSNSVGDNSQFLNDLISRDTKRWSFQQIEKSHQSLINSGIKYAPYEVFNQLDGLHACYISQAPPEQQEGQRTYRTLTGTGRFKTGSYGDTVSNIAFCISDQHPAYQYLDRGHIILFNAPKDSEEARILVINQLGLDTSYIVALFALDPDLFESVATNGIFINNRDARITLLRLEKALGEKKQERYRTLKAKIFEDFEKNAQNLIVSKFQRQEVSEVVLNDIKFTPDKVTYEAITLEGEGLSTAIFNKIDSNGEFDIYTVLNVYVAHLMEEISSTPLNSNNIGFSVDRSFKFKVNGIPIDLSISKSHTRRRINGYIINNAEVERVIRRAACYSKAEEYDRFVKSVAKMSLECHDVLSNGLPVKVHIFSDRDYYEEATNAHPKMKFTKDKDGHIKVFVNQEKTLSVPIKRFVGFIREIQKLNKDTSGGFRGYGPEETNRNAPGYGRANYLYKDAAWCQEQLKELLNKHITEAKGTALTPEQQTTFVDGLLAERTLAAQKSLELLKSVVKETGAEKLNYNGMDGYKVKGSLRSYFVDEKTNRTFNLDQNGKNICIVDGRGDMGVGYDALVARLLALKNDKYTVNTISTLKAG